METKESLLPPFVDLLLDTVFLVNAQGRIVYVSAACERMFGYAPDEMIGQQMVDLIAPEDRERTLAEAAKVMAGQPRIGFENRYIRKDGRRVHLMWSAQWSEQDQMRIGVARDITELKHAKEMQEATYAVSEAVHNARDLAALFERLHQIIAKLVPLSGFSVAIFDPKTRQISFPCQMDAHGSSAILQETAARRYCGEVIRDKRLITVADNELTPPKNAGISSAALGIWLVMPLIAEKKAFGALILKTPLEASLSDKDKDLLHFISAQVATAVRRRQLSDELLRTARYDELTGLPNRRALYDRIQSVLAKCKRRKSRMAMLFVDLDEFKKVNDSHGHATGDLLLQKIALRLKDCLREEDTVARIGGDEFVVLLEEIDTPADVLTVADKIRHVVSQPMKIDNCALQPRASIGVAVYPDHGVELEQLLNYADKAMYWDKKGQDYRLQSYESSR